MITHHTIPRPWHYVLTSGGSRSTISVTALWKSVLLPDLMTFSSTCRVCPSLQGKVCVMCSFILYETIHFVVLGCPLGTYHFLAWCFVEQTTTSCVSVTLALFPPSVPEDVGQVLKLQPVRLIEISNSKLTCRSRNDIHLLCMKNSWCEYKGVIGVSCHWDKGSSIDDCRNFWHEGYEDFVGKFVFQLEEHRVQNSPCKPNHPFPCSIVMRGMCRVQVQPWSDKYIFTAELSMFKGIFRSLQAPTKFVP